MIASVFCEEKITLVADYATAVAAYSVAAQALEGGMITGSAEIYAKLRKATEEARALCEAARQELDQHEGTHKCGRNP
jgi:hypothetical protein